MLRTLLTAAFLAVAAPSPTALADAPPATASTGETIAAKVNGLVCDFCARATEKVFMKRDEVADIDVNLDTGIVTIALKPGASLDDATVKKLIADSGYALVSLERTKG